MIKKIEKLNKPVLYVGIFTIAWLYITIKGYNTLRNPNKRVILSSVSGEQEKPQLEKNYLKNIEFDKILENLENENKIKVENKTIIEIVKKEKIFTKEFSQETEIILLKDENTSNLSTTEKIIVGILKDSNNKSLSLEELKNQYLENSYSMKKYLEALTSLQNSGYIKTNDNGDMVLDSSIDTFYSYLAPNEKVIIVTFKENLKDKKTITKTELKNQYMIKTPSYKSYEEALRSLKNKNKIEQIKIKEDNKVINFLQNNLDKNYSKDELKRELFLKNDNDFNNSKIKEVSKHIIKLGDDLNYSSLKDSEKKLISILYQNKDITKEQLEEKYLDKNFEVDYQELLKDNILIEDINSKVYEGEMSSNEKFFIVMSILFILTLLVRGIKDFKNIVVLEKVRDKIDEERDFSNFNEIMDKISYDFPIKKQWVNYRENLAEKYRMIDPDFFFNFDILYRDEISYRLFSYIPQMLLGIGMLGTFYGLSLGLSSLDLSTMNSIQDSVGELLSGVKTAFYTSLFGLIFSLLLSFFYGLYFSSIDKIIVKIKNESIKFISKSSEKNPLDRIIDALDGIKSSNNDMAKNLSNQLELMGVKISEGISKGVGTNLVETVKNSLDKIFDENVITNLNESLNKTSEVFLENSKKMVEFKDEIQSSIGQLSELKDSYVEVLKETTILKSEFRETMESINNKLQSISIEVDGVSEKYKETSSNLGDILESIVTSQDNSIQLLEENKNVMKVATTLLENSKNILDAEKSVQELWNSYEDTFKEINSATRFVMKSYDMLKVA